MRGLCVVKHCPLLEGHKKGLTASSKADRDGMRRIGLIWIISATDGVLLGFKQPFRT